MRTRQKARSNLIGAIFFSDVWNAKSRLKLRSIPPPLPTIPQYIPVPRNARPMRTYRFHVFEWHASFEVSCFFGIHQSMRIKMREVAIIFCKKSVGNAKRIFTPIKKPINEISI